MKFIIACIFLIAALQLQAQQSVVAVVQATYTFGPAACTSYAQPFDGCVNDSTFACTKYDIIAIEAFGNSGEYCKVRFTAGGTNYGSIKVYVGQPKNIVNNNKQFGYAIITAGTLTSWTSSDGSTVAPSVECTGKR